jgi:hypothetical protein
MWHARLAVTGSLVAVLSADVAAQDAAKTRTRKLSVTVYVGNVASSTASDLERAMRSSGYTQAFGGCSPFIGCVPNRPSPESYSHANPSLLAVRYAVTEHYGFETLVGGGAQGTTSGRSSSEILDVAYSGTVLASMLSAGTSAIRVGVGPALLRANWDYRSPDSPSNGAVERVRTTSAGWVGSATARWSIKPRFYAEGTAQYRGFASPAVRPRQSGRPSGRASVSHSYMGLGVGLALQ